MRTSPHSKCRSVSNMLLLASLCILGLAIPLFPLAEIFWFVGVSLAATGLLVRLLGVMQIRLAAWTVMIVIVSATILGCLCVTENAVGEWRYFWAGVVLPALLVWILATYVCWLFVDRAIGADRIGEKCATFTLCSLGPPAIVGTIITTIGAVVCLITCPLSHHQGKTLGMAVIWGFCSTACWWIALTYRDLVRSARNANKAQCDAARRIQAGA